MTIQGRVKLDGASSIALDRINLRLESVDENTLPGEHAVLKKDGTFEMKSVHNGNYTLFVWGLENDAYVKSIRFGCFQQLVYQHRVGRFRVECRVMDQKQVLGIGTVQLEVVFKGRFSDLGLPGVPPA